MKNIMLDLETLGNKPGCVIVAIGAVYFGGGKLGAEFYRRVDAESCERAGLHIDAATVLWWMKQTVEARNELVAHGALIGDALLDFTDFIAAQEVKVWGNGSDFDNVILAQAYHKCNQPLPWAFWNNRCYRTVKNLYPATLMKRTGTAHNALEDAKSQARHLMELLPNL